MPSAAGQINGVAGPLDADQLGLTLPHEHILFDTTAWLLEPSDEKAWLTDASVTLETRAEIADDPLLCRRNLLFQDEAQAAVELGDFRAAGGGTIIDVTPPAMGRDVVAVKRVADASDVNVVVGTGHYGQSTHPAEVAKQTDEEIAAWMIDEIEHGIDGSGIKPGVIGEIGTSGDIHPDERKCLRAAALTQQHTGLAITVHCAIPHEKVGVEIVEILADAGADPQRCILGHMSHTIHDLDYHRAAAATGACLQYDRFGADFLYESWGRYEEPRDSTVVGAIATLVAEGLEEQIMLSHDVCYRVQLRRFGGRGYGHVARHVVPALRDAGVSDDAIARMIVQNPARILPVR
ncbi:MAG: phosphotriesterase family protein [Gaiellaceae bacterium]